MFATRSEIGRESFSTAYSVGFRALLAGIASAAMSTSSFAQNYIQNPGFEAASGCSFPFFVNCMSSPPWIYTGGAFTTTVGGSEHSGTNALVVAKGPTFMGPNGTGAGTASQSINILGSGTYTFSFWDSGVFGATFSLTATVGPTTVFNANVTNDAYVQ